MDTYNDKAMVALLPTTYWWCNIPLPHTTLIFVGKISKLEPTLREELIRVAENLSILCSPVNLKVLGILTLGHDEEPVHVLNLVPNKQLLAMRSFLEEWDNSEFPDYKPHATIGPVGSLQQDPPILLSFDRILVSWGVDEQTFWLRDH